MLYQFIMHQSTILLIISVSADLREASLESLILFIDLSKRLVIKLKVVYDLLVVF